MKYNKEKSPAASGLFDELSLENRFVDNNPERNNQDTAQMPVDGIQEHKTDETSPATELGGGRLPADARRALIGLMRQGVIMAQNKRLLFEAICRHKQLIEDHLADMYLRILVDERAGLAILLQRDDNEQDDEDISTLISRRTLSLYDTLLLLVLRKHYQERETKGEQRIFIDIDRIEAQLTPFLPLTNSSRRDRRLLSGALKHMKERRLLLSVRGDEERFEITPVIRYVVNAEFLQHMIVEYQTLAVQAGADVDGVASDGE